MKKVYISCYDNLDFKYKNYLIQANKTRNERFFEHIDNSLELAFKVNLDPVALVQFVKKSVLKNTEINLLLISLETKKRQEINWLVKATMLEYGLYPKAGFIIVYLPDVVKKYGPKIPHSVLPFVLSHNIKTKKAYVVEILWDKLIADLNVLESLLNTAYAYTKMSDYELI